MIELALLLPLLVALFLGTWLFGYSYYIYGELEHTVRAGARYASLLAYDTTQTSAYQSAVQNVVVYGDPSPASGTWPIAPSLQTTNVQVVVTRAPVTLIPTSVTVSISGYQLPGIFGGITLKGKPALSVPFLGPYVP